MPLVAEVLHPINKNNNIFQCKVNDSGTTYCTQCQFITSKHTRCKLRSCLDFEYCWLHLRKKYHIKVAPSKIKVNGKSIGLGLFAKTDKPLSNRMREHIDSRMITPQDKKLYLVFKSGDIIGKYEGEQVDAKELSRRYDYVDDNGQLVEQTAPYAVVGNRRGKKNTMITDALCLKNYVSFANDARNSEYAYNATLTPGLYLKATRNIWQGDEILWNYQRSYWDGTIADVKYTKRRNSKNR